MTGISYSRRRPRRSGTLWCVSSDAMCVCWTDRWRLQGIKSFAVGQHHMVALAGNGKVYSIGRGEYGRLGHGGSDELHE